MIGLSESLISSVKVYIWFPFLESQSIACLNCTPDKKILIIFQNLVRQAVHSLRLVAFFIAVSQRYKQSLDQRAETAIVLL